MFIFFKLYVEKQFELLLLLKTEVKVGVGDKLIQHMLHEIKKKKKLR